MPECGTTLEPSYERGFAMRARLFAIALLAGGSLAGSPALGAPPTHTGPATRAPLSVGPTEVVTSYPIVVAQETQPPNPVSTTDGRGVVTVVWSQQAGLRAAQRLPDGTWTSSQTLDTCAAPEPYCVISGYSVGADGAGTVTAVWSKPTGQPATYRAYTASMPPGGVWSTAEPLDVNPFGTTLTVGRNGAMLLTYQTWVAGKGHVVVAEYRAPGAPWSAIRKRVFAHSQQPQAGLSDRGAAVLVVRGVRGPASAHVRAYRFLPGRGWGRPHLVGVSFPYDIPTYTVAVAGSGRAVVAWMAGEEDHARLRARVMGRRGVWGSGRTVSRPASFSPESEGVAIQGAAYVIWTTPHAAIRYAVKRPGKRWAVGVAYPRNTGYARALDVNARGDMAVMLQGASRTPGPQMLVGLYSTVSGWSNAVKVPWIPDDIRVAGSISVAPDGAAVVVSDEGVGDPWTDFRVVAWKVTAAR
jgi:hypothetical protein